ncbi:MAG: urea carboxylase [Rhodococcus sp. (in: high G+C Gram-positive bacteria)]|uniref:urea carboxylase n=1 Tax=Rhodococcus sp. TaxID=1831 RepID=UPI002AD729AF|nr:urea carboxylase [Rhodococcus sp. (in: high G+C Gram-positive bacteria)]
MYTRAVESLSFDTILVANRGEIACRIFRTAQQMGLKTVAVYSDPDQDAAHVRMADQAVRLGPAPAAQSYLRTDAVIDAALSTGAGAIHPGYGFLSENVDFASAVEAEKLVFVGPTPEQLRVFGNKHTAREAAAAAGVPLVPGTALLTDLTEALGSAEKIGYPVILKAVGGGGGIGMQACFTSQELTTAYDRVIRLAENNFGSSGVFLERFVAHARHVEVQIFGDGEGRALSLGTRDCSLQRRNQKVMEEAPAANLPAGVEQQLLSCARELTASLSYRSAGTVEFVYDTERAEASFLEVNTRLQVEHPVTEEITGVDLVEWMIRLAGGDTAMLADLPDSGPAITGHAVEARVYAEDPGQNYRPSAGLVTHAEFPTDTARVETHLETGSTVSSYYDPMIAKVIVHRPSRTQALHALSDALSGTRIYGVTTNLPQLRHAATSAPVLDAAHTTSTLSTLPAVDARIDVERAGVATTIQDAPGRLGLWNVGIPPSGPFDDLSFALANRTVGNPADVPGLECTLQGPRLRFTEPVVVAVTGAPTPVTVDGSEVPMWTPLTLDAGAVLDIGTPDDAGLRTYLAVRGGIDAPYYHGSASTFTLGGFGGTTGKAVATGDVIGLRSVIGRTLTEPAPIPASERPEFTHLWHLAVGEGPQPAPDYFTDTDMQQFYDSVWTVQPHANRTGIRLDGPKPTWARTDGGDAGLHPSNLHDCPYSVGALNVSGDTPILLGPDGPSLGGFACPLTVISAHRWKLGQIRPGDRIEFVPVSDDAALELRSENTARALDVPPVLGRRETDNGILGHREATDTTPRVRYLRGGDDNIMVEYGPMTLDLGLRMRIHALSVALTEQALPGLIDITPGVRSLHLHFDPDRLPQRTLIAILDEIEHHIPATTDLVVPSRTITLPMSFDDPSILDGIDRYRTGVRTDAPWLPSNTEFIRRINGLDSIEDVRTIVFDAEYLVLGLGDVYLGAPLAVPLDPRHRLVTTKYNPARTWTPSDAVGIGGKYMCVYGMESPGGYQLVGRTVPIWSGHRQQTPFTAGTPWLFRYFDRITWTPVSPEELTEARHAAAAGRFDPDITDGTFALADHMTFLDTHAASIATFEATQTAAFEIEKAAWHAAGEFDRTEQPTPDTTTTADLNDLPEGATVIEAPMVGTVWRIEAHEGQNVDTGDVLAILEAMKLELPITATEPVQIDRILVEPGGHVESGTPLLVLTPISQLPAPSLTTTPSGASAS